MNAREGNSRRDKPLLTRSGMAGALHSNFTIGRGTVAWTSPQHLNPWDLHTSQWPCWSGTSSVRFQTDADQCVPAPVDLQHGPFGETQADGDIRPWAICKAAPRLICLSLGRGLREDHEGASFRVDEQGTEDLPVLRSEGKPRCPLCFPPLNLYLP